MATIAVGHVGATAWRPRVGEWVRPFFISLAVALTLAVTMVAGLALLAQARFEAGRAVLLQRIASAEAAGYTTQDLEPLLRRTRTLGAGAPVLGDRIGFMGKARRQAETLSTTLPEVEAAALKRYRASAEDSLSRLDTAIAADSRVGVSDSDLTGLREGGRDAARALTAAASPPQFRQVVEQATRLNERAAGFAAAMKAENDAIQAAANVLKAQHAGNLDEIRNEGGRVLSATRDEAAIAMFLKLTGFETQYARMERFSAQLSGADTDEVAFAAAAIQHYGTPVHTWIAAHMPSRVITVSLASQHVWAIENGRPVMDTIAATGRPELPTDIGPMKVLWKSSPWTMHSPFPKGSPFWYADTKVRKVLWFTMSGEGLHDASWRTVWGPGADRVAGSHGCINLPGTAVDFLYDWAPVDTPVIVIPGDGSPAAAQVARDTIDAPGAASVQHGS
jgi:lipoprotein-anchoring transpeptidase ErfK/SrfK